MKKLWTLILILLLLLPAFDAFAFKAWRQREHATDCTSLTDGKASDICFEVDDKRLYVCEPDVGDCSGSEWKLIATPSGEIDHNLTLNYQNTEHINWQNTDSNLLTTGNMSLGADNTKLYVGASQDASMYYDGDSLNFTSTGIIDFTDENLATTGSGTIPEFYVDSIRSACCNSISVQPDGDLDDFFSFKSPVDRPTLKREGGKYIYFDSSNVYDMGISFREDDTYSGTLNYEKDNHALSVVGKAVPFLIKTNSDYDSYIKFQIANSTPEMTTVGANGLQINSGGASFLMLNHSGGNVSIGNISPQEKLHVSGSGSFEGGLITTGSITIDSDSARLYLGAGQDASLYYDGADLYIDPKEIGAGDLIILGDVDADGFTLDQSEALTMGTGTVNHDGIDFVFDDEVNVPDDVYAAGWNGDLGVPTKNAVYDQMETLGGDVTGVGDCTSGACLDGSSDGGTYIRLYDGDSNYTEINNGDANQAANLKWVLPDTNGTAGQILEIASVASDTITLEWDADGGGSAGFVMYLNPQQAKLPGSDTMVISAGSVNFKGLFDDSTDECARWQQELRPYNAGGFNFDSSFTMLSATSGTVEFDVYVDCRSDNDDMYTDNFGSVNNITGAVDSTLGQRAGMAGALSNEDSCTEGDTITVKVCRDSDVVGDASGDLEFWGGVIYE